MGHSHHVVVTVAGEPFPVHLLVLLVSHFSGYHMGYLPPNTTASGSIYFSLPREVIVIGNSLTCDEGVQHQLCSVWYVCVVDCEGWWMVGASLSEPHTSVTALCMCVCMYACLSVCGHILKILNEHI